MNESAFERFWKAYPASPRKGGKIDCQKRWDRYKLDIEIDTILRHLAYMATTETWLKGNGAFIPMPATYLNQRRWDGAEIPETKPIENPLAKIEQDRKNAVPMPDHIRERLQQLRNLV